MPSRVWFNAWDSIPEKQIKYLALDEIPPTTKTPYPSSLLSTTPFTGTQSNEPWYFSSCSLEGTEEIIVCRDTSLRHKPIIGLQLQYVTGHKTCVGQFRFDMALETIRVEVDMAIYISSSSTEQRFPYVSDVTADPPLEGGELKWIKVHRDGVLQWWFSSRQTRVCKSAI